MEREAKQTFYRLEPGKIAFLKFILEGYDGLAVLTTIDAGNGIIMIRVAPGCEIEFEALMRDLKKSIQIAPYPYDQS